MSNTIKKTAGDLRVGDIFSGLTFSEVDTARYVVLRLNGPNLTEHGMQIARLGAADINERPTTRYFRPDDVVTVGAPDQRATDAEIDQLVEATRDYLESTAPASPLWTPARREKLAKLVDRLAPVQAPTLAEALDALRVLTNEGAVGPYLNAATRLLDRARRAGVMP